MTPSTKLVDAAARLGVPVAEVTKVEDSPAGLIITTFDGIRYVDVAADNPDAAGRSGLMLLAAPTTTYGGSLPVYSQPGAGDEAGADYQSADALTGRLAGSHEFQHKMNAEILARIAAVEERLSRLETPLDQAPPDVGGADVEKAADAGFERPAPAAKAEPAGKKGR